jgi:hypothetical protein
MSTVTCELEFSDTFMLIWMLQGFSFSVILGKKV